MVSRQMWSRVFTVMLYVENVCSGGGIRIDASVKQCMPLWKVTVL